MEDAHSKAGGARPRKAAAKQAPPETPATVEPAVTVKASGTKPSATAASRAKTPEATASDAKPKQRRTSAAAVRASTATTAVPDSTTTVSSPRTTARPAKNTRPAKDLPTEQAGNAAPAKAPARPRKAAKKAESTGQSPPIESAAIEPVHDAVPTVEAVPSAEPAADPVPTAAPIQPEPDVAVQPPIAGTLPEPDWRTEQPVPLWAWLIADPGYAPQHAAREAVRRIGPEARHWVDRMRERYPAARPDGIARLAAAEFGRAARRHGSATSAAGVLGSIGATGVIAQEQARLVLAVAAAYDFDPTARERADELLELLRLPRLNQKAMPAVGNAARLLAGVAVRRVAARLVPFGAALTGAIQGARGTDDVARRAMAHYRALAGKP
jgi:hypothetical protein